MIDRLNKVLIGKAINRTSSLVLRGASQNAAEGEIVVLDKNLALLAAGSTIADTDTIYVAEVTGDTYNYVNEAGTAVTGVRKLIMSDPIEGGNVINYTGRAYTAAAEEVVTIDMTSLTPVVGTEYVIRVVYTDTYERPGQVTATYRYISTTATLATFLTNFAAVINKHAQRRANATTSASVNLILTGRALPYDSTDTVDAIDEYSQVNFQAFLYSANFATSTITYTTRPTPGNGTWQRVRDVEKAEQSNKGILNRTVFPVIKPAMRTVKSTNYDTIVIESNKSYRSPDSYDKNTRLTTEVYLPTTAGQANDVLAVLNPWMASLSKQFDNINF